VIDRSGIRTEQYYFMQGLLDAQTTKTIRPVAHNPSTWGFFDHHDSSAAPISEFHEDELGLREYRFSHMHPNSRILVPSMASMLYLSDYMQYSHNMPKHKAQIDTIKQQVHQRDIPKGLDDAYRIFTGEMKARHASEPYARARRIFFNAVPKIAYSIQQAQIGRTVRAARGVPERIDTPLHISDL
jgi:hypothetical protein